MFSDKQKRVLIAAHRWLALALAPVFFLILLSGAFLAFKPMLQDAAAPVPVDLRALVATLDAVDPQGDASRLSISRDGRTVELRARGDETSAAFDIASAVPVEKGFDVFAFALDLHKNLLAGAGIVVEIASYAMLGVITLGVFLGWPKLRNTLAGWHIGIGWLALPPVVLPPVTAVLMILHVGRPEMPATGPAREPVTLARAIEIAGARADLSGLQSARTFCRGAVVIRSATAQGEVIHVVSGPARVTSSPASANLVHALHEGTWAGGWSGLINLLSTIGLMGLLVTGVYSWWRRWRQSHRRSGDKDARTLVAFASQTGTAARLAEATASALRAAGEAVACASLATVLPRELAGFRHTLLIVSTTGEGDVPDQARPFLAKLASADLHDARFSLLALGDSRYKDFCGGGRRLRDALVARGATETVEWRRVDCEPAQTWRSWLEAVARELGLSLGKVETIEADTPVTLTLVERERLDDPSLRDVTETWRLSFEPEQGDLEFRPGDLLLVSPGGNEPPRCYSIGTSSKMADPRIDLTVSLNTWRDEGGNPRTGLASGFLCRVLEPGAKIAATLRRNLGFNPPQDVMRPIILVAAGAGIAPFPGFLAERAQANDAGPAWLLFGNRRREGDFFYRSLMERRLAQGTLTRLDTAFSRDAVGNGYIQDRMLENSAEIFRWLTQRRGVLYTCGRARTVGASVEATLRTIIARHGAAQGLRPDETLARWKADGTLRIDVFG